MVAVSPKLFLLIVLLSVVSRRQACAALTVEDIVRKEVRWANQAASYLRHGFRGTLYDETVTAINEFHVRRGSQYAVPLPQA